jgi:recombination DNA repair RAD52 pathway protein
MDVQALQAPLDSRHVKARKQGGASVSYIEAWHAIAEANRIFGHGKWSRETFELKCVCERERKIGKDQKDGWTVTYIARVRITVQTGDGLVEREGSGAGHGIGVDLGECHESALKEAESDAMKRALMTFGNPFGLALYDKDRREVVDGEAAERLEEEVKAKVRFIDGIASVAELKAFWEELYRGNRRVADDPRVIAAKENAKARLMEDTE